MTIDSSGGPKMAHRINVAVFGFKSGGLFVLLRFFGARLEAGENRECKR